MTFVQIKWNITKHPHKHVKSICNAIQKRKKTFCVNIKEEEEEAKFYSLEMKIHTMEIY